MSLERRASLWCVCRLATSVPVRVWSTSKPRVVTVESEVLRRLQEIAKRQDKEQLLPSLTRLQSAWQALHQAESIRNEVIQLIKAYLPKETVFRLRARHRTGDLFSPNITDRHRIREDQYLHALTSPKTLPSPYRLCGWNHWDSNCPQELCHVLSEDRGKHTFVLCVDTTLPNIAACYTNSRQQEPNPYCACAKRYMFVFILALSFGFHTPFPLCVDRLQKTHAWCASVPDHHGDVGI